jgi:hypothetical protein
VIGYGNLGCSAVLADDQRWLRLSWETREDAILLAWGHVLPPGRFNGDPYRNPRPLQELIPNHSVPEIESVGAVSIEDSDNLHPALFRLAQLVRQVGQSPLTAR